MSAVLNQPTVFQNNHIPFFVCVLSSTYFALAGTSKYYFHMDLIEFNFSGSNLNKKYLIELEKQAPKHEKSNSRFIV